ncbi:hypothetical protein CS550_04445 [Porphyromonas gingivalis]|nr:hypothetical protein CS550_04445 [Porphyromonas gingivalis]
MIGFRDSCIVGCPVTANRAKIHAVRIPDDPVKSEKNIAFDFRKNSELSFCCISVIYEESKPNMTLQLHFSSVFIEKMGNILYQYVTFRFFVACRRSVAHYTNTAAMAIKLWLKAG